MPPKKRRIEIPPDVAAVALFASDRTCCVCNDRNKPIQLHHIDGDPSNSIDENLAVLCFDCHRDTQIRGGFDRKLDAFQVRLYKTNWLQRVQARRGEVVAANLDSPDDGPSLRYVQLKEMSEKELYSFEADYALVRSQDKTMANETNILIEAFLTQKLQHFRSYAVDRPLGDRSGPEFDANHPRAWSTLDISHSISLFTPKILSLEFHLSYYFSGAAHPNSYTESLNFSFDPPMQLGLSDIFKPSTNYLELLSQSCIVELHQQKAARFPVSSETSKQFDMIDDEWIRSGASPEWRHFKNLSLKRYAVVAHFDPYQVGSGAEGKYDVSIPAHIVRPVMKDEVATLLDWR